MADANNDDPGGAEPLLRRLRRLTIRAEGADAKERARIIALIDDMATLRGHLVRESVRLDEELRRAAVRVTAIGAYARGAQAIRTPYRRGN
jgi:hypothetical protein